MADLPIGNALV